MGALRTWSGWKHCSHKFVLLCVGASRRRSMFTLSFPRSAPVPMLRVGTHCRDALRRTVIDAERQEIAFPR